MQPPKLNKIKRAVCFLVIFSLVLQISFYPLAANAAEGSLQKFFKKLFSGFSLPDKIELTKKGRLMLGNNFDILNSIAKLNPALFFSLPEDPDKPGERCVYIDPKTGKCASPVDEIDTILFGATTKENNFLKDDGSLNITQPAVPRVCQLNIIRPIEKGGEDIPEDEQLARRRACNNLIRLQTAASQVAFSAKSVFQKTDPKGDCLFLKNCKSDCVLRFGEIKYTITIFDIAEFLLPTGWLSLVKKIVNVIGMLGEIKNVVTAASAIFTDGINLVNGFIKTFNYLGNLFTALDNLGGNLSAYLGVVAVVAQGTIGGLDEAGVDITKTTRTVVNVGTAAVGGLAAASVLNKSFGSMQDMLGRFSDNMLAYGQAKTQTNQLLLGIRKDIIDIMEGNMAIGLPGIKKEEELAFLFQPQNPGDSVKKQELDKIVTDFRSFFENSTELLQRMSLPGQLIGETVLEVHKGTQSEYNALATPAEGRTTKVSVAYDFGKPVDTVYGDRTYSANFCSGETGGYGFDPIYLSVLGIPSMANDLVAKTEPEYIKSVLDNALGAASAEAVNYNMAELDESKEAWRLYWEYIGRIILGDSEVNKILAMEECWYFNEDGKIVKCRLGEIQRLIREKKAPNGTSPFYFLQKIAGIDRVVDDAIAGYGGDNLPIEGPVINYAKDSNRTKTIEMLFSDYANARLEDSFIKFDQPADQKVCAFAGDRVIPWDTNCPTGTRESAAGVSSDFKIATAPENILALVEGALGGTSGTKYDNSALNYSKGAWRVRWEEIGRKIGVDVDGILAKSWLMETKHKAIMNECVGVYPFLDFLRNIENNDYKQEGAVARLSYRVDVYGAERQKAGLFNGCDFGSKTWLETFQQSYAEINGLASIFAKVSPNYLKNWLPTILNCYKATPEDNIRCELNWKNDDWRHYWESLYSAIYGWDALNNLLSQDLNMDEKLEEVQIRVIAKYSPAQTLYNAAVYCTGGDVGCDGGIQKFIEGHDMGYANIRDFIVRTINGSYTTNYNNFTAIPAPGGFSQFTKISVSSAIEQIGQLKYQDEDLQHNQNLLPTNGSLVPERFINGKFRKYWQSEIWCDNALCSQDVYKFKTTYNSDLADVDWQGRINAMIDAPNNLLLVQEAMDAKLAPDTPLINYKIEKASKDFYNAVINTQEKFYDVMNDLTYGDPCYLASSFHWGVERYISYPDEQWYECPSNADYCCNKSDCQTKLDRALSSCGWGTPVSEQEWQDHTWKAYQKYRFVERWFYSFAGYKSIEYVLNEHTQTYEPVFTYTPLKETYANIIVNKIKIIVEALDYIWQNDISIVSPENKMDWLKEKILDKLKIFDSWETNEWLITAIKSYFDGFGLGAGEESSVSRKFVANILATKYLVTTKLYNSYYSDYDYGYVASLDNLFKSDEWRELLSPEEMKAKIDAWPESQISQTKQDELMGVIDNILSPALSAAQTGIIDKFKQNLGRYAFGWTLYPDFASYSASSTCPNDIETQGFLSRLSCFEMKNKATFEKLKYPLQGISELEKALFFLTDADQDFDGTSSIKQNVGNLKPSIKTDEMEIDASLGSDLFRKITGVISNPIGALWRKFSKEEEGTPPKLTTNKGEIRNWKDFKEALIANPILALQEDFNNIKAKIGQVKENLDKANWNIDNLWRWDDPEKNENYNTAVWEIANSRLGKLDASVFGNKENQQACQGVSILLGSAMPIEIEQTCKLAGDGGKRNPVILNDLALGEQCARFERIAELDSDIDLTKISSEIANLKIKMACITQEDCANGTKPCIKCPEWFCLNPIKGTWGSDDSQDPKCANNPPRLFNHIIWPDTLVGPPESSSQVKNEVCKQADIGYSQTIGDRDNISAYTCSWGQLQGKCTEAENANVFDNLSAFSQTCTVLPEIEQVEALRQEMACIAVEDCANGYKAGAVLHPTKNRPCVACPINQSSIIPSACLKLGETSITYTNLDANPDGANLVAGNYEADSNRIKQECQAKQNIIDVKQAIIDAAASKGVVGACPWSSWPCQTRNACENLRDACNLGASALKPATGRDWPPQTGCPYNTPPIPFAQKYQGAQDACIASQQLLDYLQGIQRDGSDAIGMQPEAAIKCTELNYQKSLKSECDDYEAAKGAIKDSCGDLSNDVPASCPFAQEQGPCKSPREICQNVKIQIRAKFCSNNYGAVLGGLDCSNGFPDIISSSTQMEQVGGLCEEVQDIKTPLNEIMKVYSVLIGIRSGTLASGGIKSTITDSKKLFENIKKFIKIIEELPKKVGDALDGKNSKFGKGGFKITPLKCIAKPAASTAGGQLKTGADGGLVCPEVSVLYQQIQGQFAVIRDQLHKIDLARRVVDEITIPLWRTEKQKGYISIFNNYPIKYRSIDPVYDRAASIKQKTQYVWALTTAIDFANSQCVCGQSFCKLPFCISGLPLTLQPLKDPYCSLVWLLRTPLDDLARSLNDELKNLPDNLK